MSALVISLPLILAEELNLVLDANGNLVTGDSFYREYNELNQLIRIREGNTSTGPILEEYIWHPLEERILVKDVFYNGVKNYSIYYVNDNYIHIENSSGNYSEKYLYMDNQLVAFVDTDGNKRFVHSDHLGSVSLITDIDGNVVEETFYSPHGEILEGGKSSRFDYEGKEFDPVTETLDFHFRQCKPEWGCIFFQPDTLIQNAYDPQSLNRYSFEENNPYGRTDETGHLPIVPVIIGVSALIGGIANTISYYSTHQDTNFGDAAAYFTSGAVAGGAAAVGAIGGVGVAMAATVAFLGGAAGELIENVADDISIEDNLVGVLTSGALNSASGFIGGKLFPTKALNKNIANMKNLFKLVTTKSGNEFLTKTSFDIGLSNSLSISIPSIFRSTNVYQQYQESNRQAIIKQRESGTYSGGAEYNKVAGAYVTEEGRVYPTNNPNWKPNPNAPRYNPKK